MEACPCHVLQNLWSYRRGSAREPPLIPHAPRHPATVSDGCKKLENAIQIPLFRPPEKECVHRMRHAYGPITLQDFLYIPYKRVLSMALAFFSVIDKSNRRLQSQTRVNVEVEMSLITASRMRVITSEHQPHLKHAVKQPHPAGEEEKEGN